MAKEESGLNDSAAESLPSLKSSGTDGLSEESSSSLSCATAGISTTELYGWLELGAVKGLSGHSVVGLVNRYGSPGAVIDACRGGAVPDGIRPKLAGAIAARANRLWAQRELALAAKIGITVLAYSDPRYPALLKEIPDPPHLLYVRGTGLELLSAPSVGVVGTRLATHYGRAISKSISQELANLGIVVVSGGARGCDTAAHSGVLKAGGATIAVLGTGVDITYPKENGGLYEQIVQNGLLVSEFALGTPPAPYNFPRRNRIISGLCLGVLIAEAPVRSGALMTARFALEQNREVFAVPGSVASEKSKGANKLLKEGAALVESAADIVEALSLSIVAHAVKEQRSNHDSVDEPAESGIDFKDEAQKSEEPKAVTLKLSAEEEMVFKCLSQEPVQIDSIIASTGLSVATVSTVLLGLELKGLVAQRPGKYFVKIF